MKENSEDVDPNLVEKKNVLYPILEEKCFLLISDDGEGIIYLSGKRKSEDKN